MKDSYKSYSDAQLTELLNERDMIAYEEVYTRYWQKLYLHAYRMLKDENQAEDIVQDLFTTLLVQMGKFTYQSTISAYLYTSIRNMVLNVFKHQTIKTRYVADLTTYYDKGEYYTDNQVRENELKKQIEQEIENLPPKMRAVFEMSRKAYLNHQQIAKQMGSTPGTVKRQISQAIVKLRSRLSCIFFMQLMANILWIHSNF